MSEFIPSEARDLNQEEKMITILWLTGIITLFFGAALLIPGSIVKISYLINKIIYTIDSEKKLRLGSAISLLLISLCSFF